MRVLVLGGTAEARALAARLVAAGVEVESSLAGRVANPRLPEGAVRVGGFGGADGLAEYLSSTCADALVDATHPFATRISANAVAAARLAGVQLTRLLRPGWADDPRAGDWHWADDYDQARQLAERVLSAGPGRPFLTTGRQTLAHFESWAGCAVLVRVVEPLDDAPPAWTVLLDRGPYEIAGERALFAEHDVRVLLTKDSGGAYTDAKLSAATEADVDVVVVRRPAVPDDVPTVPDAAAAMRHLGLG